MEISSCLLSFIYFHLLTNTYRKWLQQWCKDTHNYVNSKSFDNESFYPGTPTKAKEQFLSQFVLRRIKNPGQVWPRAFCGQPRKQPYMHSTLCPYLTLFATTKPISFNCCCFIKVLKVRKIAFLSKNTIIARYNYT